MLQQVFHSVLSTAFSLAFAAVPALPLLGKKWPPEAVVKNIVLVHGAFTDGSCWAKVIPLLQDMGYHAVAVQNPMTSLADEVALFAAAAISRLGVENDAVEVVLGGGIFKTEDEGFHARVAAGIHAVAPNALLIRLSAPPVLGAALLGLDAIGADDEAKATLRRTLGTSN